MKETSVEQARKVDMVKIIFWVVIQPWLLIGGLHSFRIISLFFGRFLFEFVVCRWCSFGGSLRTRARRCRARRMLDRGRGTLSTFSFEIEMGEYCTGSFPRLGNLSNWGTWATVLGLTFLTIGIP